MTYVVTESCIQCKYTDCVEICPVDCFHEGPNFLVIDPEVCIDCGVCEPECPVSAIVEESRLGDEQRHFAELNARYAQTWPLITGKTDPLPEADHWSAVTEKLALLKTAEGAGS